MPPTDKIIQTLQSINGPASAHRLTQYLRPDVTYQTPTHQSQTPDGVRDVIAYIFAAGTGGRIRITDAAVGLDGLTYYLRWDRQISLPSGKNTAYSGITEMMFAPDGLIASLIDYYDPSDAPTPQSKSLLSRILNR